MVDLPRLAGVVIPGQPDYVVQRGNNRQNVLLVDDDRRAYFELLREHCERFGSASWFYQFNAGGYALSKSPLKKSLPVAQV